MRFYVVRVSLVPVEGSMFYVPRSERNLRLLTGLLSRQFEYEGKRGFRIINEPVTHAERGFVGGMLGREGKTTIPGRESGHFLKRKQTVYPHVYYAYLPREQALVIQHNTSVFPNPDRLVDALARYLDQHLTGEGLAVHLAPLTVKGQFWKVLIELGEVHEVRLRFFAPNFLGEMYADMKTLLSKVSRDTNADEIEHAVLSQTGKLTIPNEPGYKSAIGWIEDGGGTWVAIRRGKHRRVVTSGKNLTFYEREVSLEGLSPDEMAHFCDTFDLGDHSVGGGDDKP